MLFLKRLGGELVLHQQFDFGEIQNTLVPLAPSIATRCTASTIEFLVGQQRSARRGRRFCEWDPRSSNRPIAACQRRSVPAWLATAWRRLPRSCGVSFVGTGENSTCPASESDAGVQICFPSATMLASSEWTRILLGRSKATENGMAGRALLLASCSRLRRCAVRPHLRSLGLLIRGDHFLQELGRVETRFGSRGLAAARHAGRRQLGAVAAAAQAHRQSQPSDKPQENIPDAQSLVDVSIAWRSSFVLRNGCAAAHACECEIGAGSRW